MVNRVADALIVGEPGTTLFWAGGIFARLPSGSLLAADPMRAHVRGFRLCRRCRQGQGLRDEAPREKGDSGTIGKVPDG